VTNGMAIPIQETNVKKLGKLRSGLFQKEKKDHFLIIFSIKKEAIKASIYFFNT